MVILLISKLDEILDYINTSLSVEDLDNLGSLADILIDKNFIIDVLKKTKDKISGVYFKDPFLLSILEQINLFIQDMSIRNIRDISLIDGIESKETVIDKANILKTRALIMKSTKGSFLADDKNILIEYINEVSGLHQKLKYNNSSNENTSMYIYATLDLVFANVLLKYNDRSRIHDQIENYLRISKIKTWDLSMLVKNIFYILKNISDKDERMLSLEGLIISYLDKNSGFGGSFSPEVISNNSEVISKNSEVISKKSEVISNTSILNSASVFSQESSTDEFNKNYGIRTYKIDGVYEISKELVLEIANKGYIISDIIDADDESTLRISRKTLYPMPLKTYDPRKLFLYRDIHRHIANFLINSPRLLEKQDTKKVINYIMKEYPVSRIEIRADFRVFDSVKSGDDKKSLSVSSFADLVKVYNLNEVYNIRPLDIFNIEYDTPYNEIVSEWVLNTRKYAEYMEAGDVKCFPFTQYDPLFYEEPYNLLKTYKDYESIYKAHLMLKKVRRKLDFKEIDIDKVRIFIEEGEKLEEAFFVNKLSSSPSSPSSPSSTSTTQNILTLNESTDSKEIIKCIVMSLFGFLISLREGKNLDVTNLFFKLNILEKDKYGGSLKEKSYKIESEQPMIYRDIIILGKWYYSKKMTDTDTYYILDMIQDRWTRINKILYSNYNNNYNNNNNNNINNNINNNNSNILSISDAQIIIADINKNIKEIGADKVLEDYIASFHLYAKMITESDTSDKEDSLPITTPKIYDFDKIINRVKSLTYIRELNQELLDSSKYNNNITKRIRLTKDKFINNVLYGKIDKHPNYLIESLSVDEFLLETFAPYEDMLLSIIKEMYDTRIIHEGMKDIFNKNIMMLKKKMVQRNILSSVPDFAIPSSHTFSVSVQKTTIPGIEDNIKDLGHNTFNEENLNKRNLVKLYLSQLVSPDNKDLINYTIGNYISDKHINSIPISTSTIRRVIELFKVHAPTDTEILTSNALYEYILGKQRSITDETFDPYIFEVCDNIILNMIIAKDHYGNSLVFNMPNIPNNTTFVDSSLVEYNELLLIPVNKLRINEFFKLPPYYFVVLYYNFFKNMTDNIVIPPNASLKECLEIYYTIFIKKINSIITNSSNEYSKPFSYFMVQDHTYDL